MASPAVLTGCVFVIDKSIPLKKKVELIKMIKASGGASVYSVSPKATHLVTTQEGYNDSSAKVDSAKKTGVHIVSKEFVVDSITKGVKIDEHNYYFSDQPSAPTAFIDTTEAQSVHNGNTTHEVYTDSNSDTDVGNGNAPQQEELTHNKVDTAKTHVNGAQVVDERGDSVQVGVYVPPRKQGKEWREDKRVKKVEYQSHDKRARTSSYTKNENHFASYQEQDDGCKIFVGGIMLDDLDALRKTKDGFTDSPDVITHIQKLKQERLLEIIKIFNRYGTITRVKQFLDNRHIFISFDNQKAAINAIRDLKPLETRKKLIQDVRERLRIEGRQSLIAPKVNFYVRWPNTTKSYTSESDRQSGRSDSEGSWRRRSSYGLSDNDPGYGSNSSLSAFSQSEYESESDNCSPRYVHPNHKHSLSIQSESDNSDSTPRPDIRVRRAIGLNPPTPVTSNMQTANLPTPAVTQTLTSNSTPPAESGRDWLWLWSKVIILFQVVAIMAIVYFYNRGGF